MHTRRFPSLCAALAIAPLALSAVTRADSEQIPDGFELSIVAENLAEPIALEFAPDGRLFVAERNGTVRVIENGVVSEPLFPKIEVFYENENGLVGLALDPDFATNGYIYLFATVTTDESQILRFVDPKKSMTAATDPPELVRGHLPTRGVFHSGGGMKVGPDGKLYFGIGDNLIPENAQDMNTLAGKVSRMNLDGSTPEDNPFKTNTGAPRSIYALGFRNPFRFCFAPDGRLFVMDVGSDGDGRREEVDLAYAGDNCGWPIVEGQQNPLFHNPRFRDPIYDYHDGGAAPVGCVYYVGERFPEKYRNGLFQLEYVLNRLYFYQLDGDRVVRQEHFGQLDGGVVDLVQGPDGGLYYTEIDTGRIMRFSYPPLAQVAGEVVESPMTGDTAEGDDAGEADSSENPEERVHCGTGGLFGAALAGAMLLRRPR